MARKKSIDENRILDAAQQVVRKAGASALTLDMVAAEARISKGGLTYTFATKDALLSAMLDRDVSRFRAKLEAPNNVPNDASFPELRRFLEVCRASTAPADRNIGSILAAIIHAPQTLLSVRSCLLWMLSMCPPDSADGRRARLVFFAMQGLFLLQGFGLLTLSVTQRKALVEDFIRFLNDCRG